MRERRVERDADVAAVAAVAAEHHDPLTGVDELLGLDLEALDLIAHGLQDLAAKVFATGCSPEKLTPCRSGLVPLDVRIERFHNRRQVSTVERLVAATDRR